MKTQSFFQTIATGFAMFSMFFGAGNAIFPLALGYEVQGGAAFAIGGLLISAVFLPFLGLLGIYRYQGQTQNFFDTLGKKEGFIISFFILGVLGPCGAIPRCIALSYATIKPHLPDFIGIASFSLISCILIFLLTLPKKKFISILGAYLTPVLLLSLAVLIAKGLYEGGSMEMNGTRFSSFMTGLKEGYGTMDLISSFFFAPVIINAIRREGSQNQGLKLFLSCLIGAMLLSLTYIGFCLIAAFSKEGIGAVGLEDLMHSVAFTVLGAQGSFVLCLIIALACLTTAIAISLVFADFLTNTLTKGRLRYETSLLITCFATFLVATLEFNGIRALLTPLLIALYPALFVLTVLNICKSFGMQIEVRMPFYIVLAASTIYSVLM